MSDLVVCGLSYHSIPVAIRERFTIPQSCLKHALEGLKRFPHIKEAAVLSTCNRTEVYALVSDIQAGWHEIDAFFAATQSIADHGELKPNFKLLRQDVALHLMRVAAGLDSMVLGEGQIMSQVKVAHQEALQAQTAGPVLDSLFKFALTCGKRVRSETAMGRRAVSISSAAVELGKSRLAGLQDKTILVIGLGKMGQICLKHLLSDGSPAKVLVANRTPTKIESFLKNNIRNCELVTAVDFDNRYQAARAADLIIVASSAAHHILTKNEWQAVNATGKDVCIIDIGVPRNVDPSLAQIEGVQLCDFDRLAEIVQINLSEREALVADAEKIVFEVLRQFDDWQRSLLVVPTIADLREKIESIRQEQMRKGCFVKETDDVLESNQEWEGISRAIVNQILHHPTTQLKATTDYEILKQQAEALRILFNLNPLAAGTTSAGQRSGRRKSPTLN